jgi:DNA-binding LacI/PurR family transcriptional regulator
MLITIKDAAQRAGVSAISVARMLSGATHLARGVEDKAGEHGFVVLIANTDEDPTKGETYIDILLRRRGGGRIVGPTGASATLLRRLQEQNVSCVLVDRTVEGIEGDIVRSDSFAGAIQLTQYLLAKRDEPCQRLCS